MSAFDRPEKLNCPQKGKHVRGEPSGYTQWFEWAERKAKTHKQRECPGCGLFVIWERKRA